MNEERNEISQLPWLRSTRYYLLTIFILFLFAAPAAAITFKPDGHWGKRGEEKGQIINPSGIATDSGNRVYLTDVAWRGRIQQFTAAGNALNEWGGLRSKTVARYPEKIATDSADNLYVLTDKGKLKKLSPAGRTVWAKEFKSDDPVSFGLFNGVDTGPDDSVYITDSGRQRILRYSSVGQLLNTISLPDKDEGALAPVDVAVDSLGNIYALSGAGGEVMKFDSSGRLTKKWGGNFGEKNKQFLYSTAIEVDPFGFVYVVDKSNNVIQRFSSSGAFLEAWRTDFLSGDGGSATADIAFDTFGNAYVLKIDGDQGDRVNRYRRTNATPDLDKPRISKLRISRRCYTPFRESISSRKCKSRSTTVRFKLSEDARLKFHFKRFKRGKLLRYGSFDEFVGKKGTIVKRYGNHIGWGWALPGRWRLVITGYDLSNNHAKKRKITFRVSGGK